MCLTPCPPCRVWGIQTGQVINELPREVCSLKFTKDTLVTGSRVSGYKMSQLHFEVLPLWLYYTGCLAHINSVSGTNKTSVRD